MIADASVTNELRRLLQEPLALMVAVTTMAFAIVPTMMDRSRHRPGNFAPIQLISAVGAWALLLIDEALLVSSFRERSPIVACASLATLLATLWQFLRRDNGRVVNDQAPETIEALLRDIEQILGGAKRVGIESVEAVIVDTGPFIGVSVSRRGHVVVRVRQELMAWLARHRRAGGAGSAAVESLLRFTVLHELGHVLNGDHLTYRFVRSVLLAHLCWIPAAVGAAALLPWGVLAARTALATTLCLPLPFLGQCVLARRFLAEREEVADLRATQTLDPSDAALLGARSGLQTDRPNPTLLEKLLLDLNVQSPVTRRASWLSKAVRWIWPEGGQIHERCELLALGSGGRMPRPNQWAAFMGMQCALLCVSLLACAAAAFSSLPSWRPGIALRVAVILMAVTCSMAACYCGMRVDPARMRLGDLLDVPSRWTVGAVFYLSFSTVALMLYFLPAFSGVSAVLSFPLFSLCLGMSAGQAIYGVVIAVSHAGDNPENATISVRHPMWQTMPMLLMHLSIVICCSTAATWCFGLTGAGIGAWIGITLVAWAGATTSFFFGLSTNAAIRAIPPFTWPESPGKVFAIRIFWRESFFDRHATSQRFIVFIGFSTYAGSALLFACVAAFIARLISRMATNDVIFNMLLLMAGALIGLTQLVPQRSDKTAHLAHLEHLRMLESLLTAVRAARMPVAEELSSALARWLNGDGDVPSAVLPEPRAIGKLESLLLLVRIAQAVGEDKLLARWRPAVADALRHVVIDGAVFVSRSRPSLAYSALAAQVIEEADLAAEIPLEPILDSLAERLDLYLNGGEDASAEAVASACRLLGAHGRPHPAVEWMRMQSVIAAAEYQLTYSMIRGRLRELVAYIALMENTAVRNRLMSIARSRMWETLQLNPWNDVPLLLDCYLAAVSLGESDASRLSPAEAAIRDVATRIADDLMKIYGEPDVSRNEGRRLVR
jgi:hypothetical protein